MLKNVRKVESLQAAEVVHIYVDASFDREKCSGLGGMVVDMSKKTLFFFSEAVDNDTLVVLFTDSESVRGSFLKTWSANDNSDDMISVIFEVGGGI